MHSPVLHRRTPAQHSCSLIPEVELRPYATLPALGHPRNSISAELEFAFYRSPHRAFKPPLPQTQASAPNEAQPVAFCLSSKTHPTHPRNPGFPGKWGLAHLPSTPPTKFALLLSLTSVKTAMFTWARRGIREGNQAEQPRYFPGSSAAHVLSLGFGTMKLRNTPEGFRTQAIAQLLSSLFHSE